MTGKFRVIDVETTGKDPVNDRIVEIGYCNLRDGVVGEPGSVLINPGRPIPPEASAIHHITDADVVGAKTLADVTPFKASPELVYVAHKADFDSKFLTPELVGDRQWICTLKCSYRLWPDAPRHNNQALRYWLNPEGLVRELAEPSHRAGPDAYVTAHLLREMLKLATVEQLIQWSNDPALLVKCSFGKHRGTPWKDVPRDYLEWIVRQKDMDADVRFTAQHHIDQSRMNVIEAMGM